MNKEYFDKEKQVYDNIEIPEDLDFMVRKALKEGKRRKNHKIISNWSTAVAAVTISFVLAVNIFPKVAYAASLIPGVDKLVKLVTWDKGFDNAVRDGLTQTINFKETQNGITFKVEGLAGDWKKLWVYYSIDDGTKNLELSNGWTKYSIESNVILPEEYKEEGCTAEGFMLNKDGAGYNAYSFMRYVQDFELVFKIRENTVESIESGEYIKEPKYVAEFSVPIKLNSEIFNSPLIDVKLNGNVINTSAGNIEIKSLQSSKTRISLKYKFDSDIYDFMGFEEPRLVDDKGNEYTVPGGAYFSEYGYGVKGIEFAGEIKKNVENLTFICDGVYYARKDNREVVVNFKENYVEPNDYGVTFADEDTVGLVPENQKMLLVKNSKSFSVGEIYDENGKAIVTIDGFIYSLPESNDNIAAWSGCWLKIHDTNIEKITMYVNDIRKDKTEPISAKLIK